MSESRNEERKIEREELQGKKKSHVGGWLIIGVLVLIALLLVWLTVADLFGDTDVAAQVMNSVGSLSTYLNLPLA